MAARLTVSPCLLVLTVNNTYGLSKTTHLIVVKYGLSSAGWCFTVLHSLFGAKISKKLLKHSSDCIENAQIGYWLDSRYLKANLYSKGISSPRFDQTILVSI